MNLTINQIMILLDIYRGSLKQNRHLATYETDLFVLLHRGLIKREEGVKKLTPISFEPTGLGDNMVQAILKTTIQ